MIDDATIKRVAVESGAILGMKLAGIQYVVPKTANFTIDQLLEFIRAIEQLARQEQREEDAVICEHEQGHWQQVAEGSYSGMYDHKADASRECAEAIRASGKENKID